MNLEYKTLLLSSAPHINASFRIIASSLKINYANTTSVMDSLEYLMDVNVDSIFIDTAIGEDSYLEFLQLISEDYENTSTPVVLIALEDDDSLAISIMDFNVISICSNKNWHIQTKKLLNLLKMQKLNLLYLEGTLLESEERSVIDPLTGALNRYGAEDVFNQLTSRFKAYDESFCVIMIDIDHFKSINDTHGHDIGDEVLVGFSKLITTSIRQTDSLVRLGGEEFIIFLSNVSLEIAIRTSETLRKEIQDRTHSSKNLHLTASFGVVEYHLNEPFDYILKRVDELLYLAKENGRNRVISSQENKTIES